MKDHDRDRHTRCGILRATNAPGVQASETGIEPAVTARYVYVDNFR